MVNSDWVLVFATLMGPVLAVQAQKWVERARERGNTKRWITYTLMATRGARLSQEHVNALNAIDLAYYGTHFAALWAAAGSVDTGLSFSSFLERYRADVPEC